MTDDPRSHQYNDDNWEHQTDSNQRDAVTEAVNPDYTIPSPDTEETHDQYEDSED